ncbi:MAG: NAD(P)H-dependent oxidoreductase subunit E [Chloroflexi bacterium]|nr:NAD(P)H-dependent oxidoreductase subunit E [Chloroflexota bacterium]
MTEIDLTHLKPAVESCIPMGRSGLLPALHAAQKIYGWLPKEVAAEVARLLRIPLADVHGVIEFYSLFYNEQVGQKFIRVCTDQACALKGSDRLLRHLCSHYDIEPGQTTDDLSLTIERSPCLGLCEQAPAALVDEDAETNIAPDFHSYDLGIPQSFVYGSLRELTANCGEGTTTLAKYGEYKAYKKALDMPPEVVVSEIKASGLVGRGGAAFPTGVKWEGAAKAAGSQKFVVCNADESEPGTFKDRILLLEDPHRTIEGMCIAAHAIGANKGYLYIRAEYPYIVPVLEAALDEARAAGYLGDHFDIEIRVGAGAYICGEETALFESIEGKRGFPRVKPPFPITNGLFDKPTVINNVETLCNVPLIISKGSAEYRKIGTEKSPGPKLFCVSGDVGQPGLYEIPFGVTLRELLVMAGGVAAGQSLKAVLFGGAAGAFATSDHLDVKLTFEDLRAAGLPLGSGVVMVFDETRDIRDVLKRLGKFFAHESCGKCYPCQMGTQRQMEILNRVAKGSVVEGDFVRLQDVGWTMTDASLCGLGQTAASAVLSAMKLWPELFDHKLPRTAALNEPPGLAASSVKMKASKTKPEAKKTGKTARPKSNLEKKTKRVQAKKPVKSVKPVRTKKPVKKTGSKK